MITKEMLLAGMDAGVVKLYEDPRDSDIYCKIGSHRFFFKPALNADDPDGVTPDIDRDEAAEAIAELLNILKQYVGISAEYLYCEAVLQSALEGKPIPLTFTGIIRETLRREVPIIAEDEEDARSKLEAMYRDGTVTLSADDFLKSSMKVFPKTDMAA